MLTVERGVRTQKKKSVERKTKANTEHKYTRCESQSTPVSSFDLRTPPSPLVRMSVQPMAIQLQAQAQLRAQERVGGRHADSLSTPRL